MVTKRENWFHRVPSGRSRNAMRVGRVTFALAVASVPAIFYAYLKLYAEAPLWLACLMSAMMCGLWLAFADEIRKFTNGQRLLNLLRSSEGIMSTIGNFREDCLARWATLLFVILTIIAIGGFAVFIANVA